MSDSHRMSRRDWFRLLPQRSETATPATGPAISPEAAVAPAMGTAPHGLQAIPHPQNHDGMNLADLPPLREAVLSEEQVRQLFADIEAFASEILLMQRLAGSARATPSATSATEQLGTAQQRLLAGAIARVQIRYRWDDSHWIDTLERRDSGIRLVRIAHDPAGIPRRVPQ
jgi:hypothetical protein